MAKTRKPANGPMHVSETARYLGMSVDQVRYHVRYGTIPYHKLSGKKKSWNAFYAEELDAWLEETRRSA